MAGPNESRDGAPPSRPPPPPPPASGAMEPPASTPEPPEEQLHLVHPTLREVDGEDGTSQRPSVKPEASAYAGSYRPSEDGLPSVYVARSVNFDIQYANWNSTEHHHQHQGYDASHHNEPAHENHDAPPAYTELPGQIRDDNNDLGANAIVAEDGRVNISINQKTRRLSQLFAPQLHRQVSTVDHEPAPPPPYVPEFLGGAPGQSPPPPMNIVIMVVGSRGDVQPFVALGKVLKETYNHRVRLATHPTFKDFVTENGLEFFSIGGDPAELMAFMVKNPGLMPGFDTLRSGDVGQRRKGIGEILRGTWRACIETGDGLGGDPLKQTVEEWMGVEDQVPDQLKKPFVADAIIANPPSFGHIHCAEKLGIPLHMMFTFVFPSNTSSPQANNCIECHGHQHSNFPIHSQISNLRTQTHP
jgi:hypothetical protein